MRAYRKRLKRHTPHSTLHTPHSTLHTPHSTLHTPHSTLHTPHTTHHTPHSTLHTPHTSHTPHATRHRRRSPACKGTWELTQRHVCMWCCGVFNMVVDYPKSSQTILNISRSCEIARECDLDLKKIFL